MEKRLVLISVVMTIGGLVWLSALQPAAEATGSGASVAGASVAEAAGSGAAGSGAAGGAIASSESAAGADSPERAAPLAVADAAPVADSAARAAVGAGDVPDPSAVAPIAEEIVAELVDASHLRVRLSTKGGALKSAFLMDPQYDRREDAEVSSVPPADKVAPGPLDLVSTWDAAFYPFQLDFTKLDAAGVVKYDDGTTLTLESAWSPDADFAMVEQTDSRVVMVWPDPSRATSPVYVERSFRLGPKYQLEMDTVVYNLSSADATVQFDVVVHGWQDPDASTGSMFSPPADLANGACMAGDEVVYESYHDLVDEPETPQGAVQWAGTATHYFLMAAAPLQSAQTQCSVRGKPGGLLTTRIHQTQSTVIGAAPNPCAPDWLPAGRFAGPRCSAFYELLGAEPGASAKELAEAKSKAIAGAVQDADKKQQIEVAFESLSSGGQRRWHHTLYTGPKDIDALNAAGEGFSEALDFGMLGFLAVPMLYFLRWVHSVVGLWVLAIILLTVVVKIILLPLTQKSFKQMRAMKMLQPEMEKLREKHKDDKAKLNQEMMALYKQRGANPLGGCLPMVLQMPVYIALYQTIYSAVELYQAPLFGWITNMTAADPYFVLPVLLGGTMFVQQKLMPTTMDNAQAKMMQTVMPILFAGMMLFLPAGLVLYIFVNTLLGILQQWYVYRQGA